MNYYLSTTCATFLGESVVEGLRPPNETWLRQHLRVPVVLPNPGSQNVLRALLPFPVNVATDLAGPHATTASASERMKLHRLNAPLKLLAWAVTRRGQIWCFCALQRSHSSLARLCVACAKLWPPEPPWNGNSSLWIRAGARSRSEQSFHQRALNHENKWNLVFLFFARNFAERENSMSDCSGTHVLRSFASAGSASLHLPRELALFRMSRPGLV